VERIDKIFEAIKILQEDIQEELDEIKERIEFIEQRLNDIGVV